MGGAKKSYRYKIQFSSFNGPEWLMSAYQIHVYGWQLNNRVVTQTNRSGEDHFVISEDDNSTDGYIYAANDGAMVINGQKFNAPYKQKVTFYHQNPGPYAIKDEQDAFWVANRIQEAYLALSWSMPAWFKKNPLFTARNLPEVLNSNDARNHNWVGNKETRVFPENNAKRIVVIYPAAIGADVPWVNPTGHLTSEKMPSILVPENIKQLQDQYEKSQKHLLGHEFSHCVHWFYFPIDRRQFWAEYLAGIWAGGKPGHWEDKITSPLVAYLEAWGLYIGYLVHFTWKNWVVPNPVSHDVLQPIRTKMTGRQPEYQKKKIGDKVEGAVAMFMFHELAKALYQKGIKFPLETIFTAMVGFYPQPQTVHEFGQVWKHQMQHILPYTEVQKLAALWGIMLQ